MEGKTPVLVIDEEVINDTFFDLLCLDPVKRVFHTPSLAPHPLLTEKAIQMGMGLKCYSPQELSTIKPVHPHSNPYYLFLLKSSSTIQEILSLKVDNLKIALPPAMVEEALALGINPHHILLVYYFPFKLPLEGQHLPVKGIYLVPRQRPLSPSDLHNLDLILNKVKGVSEDFLLVLSAGLGISIAPESGTIKLFSTQAALEEISQALPNNPLWIDPGGLIFSGAINLFLKVRGVKRVSSKAYAFVDLDPLLLSSLLGGGTPHLVLNLSHPDPERAERLPSQLHFAGLIPCPDGTSPGDLLTITNAWPWAVKGQKGLPSCLRVEYLKARRICQVRI